jgi:hypothetical protein
VSIARPGYGGYYDFIFGVITKISKEKKKCHQENNNLQLLVDRLNDSTNIDDESHNITRGEIGSFFNRNEIIDSITSRDFREALKNHCASYSY